MFDLLIVGAGPAGATLARLAGTGCRVLLADSRPLDQPVGAGFPDRCCGGLLGPDAQRMLARLRLGLPTEVLQDPQLFSVRAVDLSSGAARHYQRFYLNLDRARFDRWLVSLVPASVETCFGWRVRRIDREADGSFRTQLSREGATTAVRSRVVVGADGPASRVRQAFFPDRRVRRYIALQEWLESGPSSACFGAYFDPDTTDFYAWTIPKGDHVIVGAALPEGRAAKERFGQFRRRLEELGMVAGRPVHHEAALILRPRGPRDLLTASQGVALVGEAGGWISPSSAEGFSFAMASASALADALAPGVPGFEARYAALMRPLRRSLWLKTVKARLISWPSLRRLLLRSGLGSTQVRP